MIVSQELLARAGIGLSSASFDELTRQMVERLELAGYVTAPERELSAEEIDALREGGFDFTPLSWDADDPIAAAAAEYVAIVETSLTVPDVARMLNVDASRVRQRLLDRTLYGLKVHGNWRIPAFQFDGAKPIPGMGEVLSALPSDLYLVSVYRWLTNPDPDLEIADCPVSPRDWLRAGRDPGPVIALADSFYQAW